MFSYFEESRHRTFLAEKVRLLHVKRASLALGRLVGAQ